MKIKIKELNFKKSINKAIKENMHADYFNEVLRRYVTYENAFNSIFSDQKNTEGKIYLFRATYLNKKNTWREIEILDIQTFYDLACEIIGSMGWDNDHMHGFDLPEKRKPDPFLTGSSLSFFAPGWNDDPHPTFKTDEIRICDIDYKKLPKLIFTFDYGDDHRFEVVFKSLRDIKSKKEIKEVPRLIDMRGVAPEQYPEYE